MCVTVGAAAAHCGPVTADVGADGQLLLRISDIAYRLEVYGEKATRYELKLGTRRFDAR